MSTSFDDWLREKHPEIRAEDRAKLVNWEHNELHRAISDQTVSDLDWLERIFHKRALEVLNSLVALRRLRNARQRAFRKLHFQEL